MSVVKLQTERASRITVQTGKLQMIDVSEILHASVKNRGFVTAKHFTHPY